MDKWDFVIFAVMSVKHSGTARQRSITVPIDGTTVHLCGDDNVAEKWINGQYAVGKKYKENIRNPNLFCFLGGRGVSGTP